VSPQNPSWSGVPTNDCPPFSARPLRICQVVPYDLAERGGVKHHALQLARALRARGDEVVTIGPASEPQADPHTVGFPGVVGIRSNGSSNRLGVFVAPWRVRAFFARHRFDVVHIHEPLIPSLTYWSAWLSRGSTRIATFHAFSERPSAGLALLGRVFAPLVRSAFRASTAVSPAAAAFASPMWRGAPRVVPNGVPTEIFAPSPNRARRGPLRLLFVGRLGDERKGYRYLEQVFRRLRARGLDLHLDVVGELGGAAPPEPAPGLTYHGPLPLRELVARYQLADIFVAPSTGQESFGIVLLEAMATARPIVCSAIEGYAKTVAPEGAILVPPMNADALEAAIGGLAARPERWHSMGQANWQRAQLFGWTSIAAHIRDLYLTALAEAPDRIAGDALVPARWPSRPLPPQRQDARTADG
jgi:phosphatidylinositol alpha-mannosyltransferase